MVKFKYANNPDKLENALKEFNKNYVTDKKLHEIRNDFLLDYDDIFKMIGTIFIGDRFRQTHIKFIINNDYETYIISIDESCGTDDIVFKGYFYKLDTPQFFMINRSEYGNSCDFKHAIIEYKGNNCYILTKGPCFITCTNYFTGLDNEQAFSKFFRIEKRRSINKTKSRVQPCLKKLGIEPGCFDGKRINL